VSGNPLLVVDGVREARLLRRPNRFTVELETVEGAALACHLHDPGRLRHLLRPGARVLYRPAWRPGRRTSCDVAAVYDGDVVVLEDTRLPNRLLPAALPLLLPGYRVEASEAPINGTRVDFVASTPRGGLALIEVKGTNLVESGVALFPDAPSRRARRQLEALAVAAGSGSESHVVFTILRPDAGRLAPHRRVDPEFSRLLCGLRGRLRYHAYTVKPLLEPGGRLAVYMGRVVPVEPCG